MIQDSNLAYYLRLSYYKLNKKYLKISERKKGFRAFINEEIKAKDKTMIQNQV